jgi:hypothetical protein
MVNLADLLVCLIHHGRENPEAALIIVPLPRLIIISSNDDQLSDLDYCAIMNL